MISVRNMAACAMAVTLLACAAAHAQADGPIGTAFTYQGQLKKNGEAIQGKVNLRFKLFPKETEGTPYPDIEEFLGMEIVSEGRFTVKLDFGVAPYPALAKRWLEVEVEFPPGSGYEKLVPRQELTPTPFSLATRGIKVDGDGNIGIGPAWLNVDEKLHVRGDRIRLEKYGRILDLDVRGTAVGIVARNTNVLVHSMGEPGKNNVLINPIYGGNVGIGTAEPKKKLDVAGDVQVQGDIVLNESGTTTVRIEAFEGSTGATIVLSRADGVRGIELDAEYGEDPDSAARVSIFNADGEETIALSGVNGRVIAQVIEITGADLAEKFPVSEEVKPGMVVAIDPDHPGQLCLARGAYNRRVAGVVSGANGLSVGAVLGNLPGHEDAPPIALSGRVWVYCDATQTPIEPGDLLTTSTTPSHAMKVTDYPRAQGAIIGKAMTSLSEGTGLVLVLISLQ